MDLSDDDAVAAAEMLGLFLKSKLDARKKRKRRRSQWLSGRTSDCETFDQKHRTNMRTAHKELSTE